MSLELQVTPSICEFCGVYLEDHYFVTDVGALFVNGIAFCSPECWSAHNDAVVEKYRKKKMQA